MSLPTAFMDRDVLCTLSYEKDPECACGIPFICKGRTARLNMPNVIPKAAEDLHIENELFQLCEDMNVIMDKFHFPWCPILLIPGVNLLGVCLLLGMRVKANRKVEQCLQQWNESVGKRKGVAADWNYGYAILQRDHSADEIRLFPPGLDVFRIQT